MCVCMFHVNSAIAFGLLNLLLLEPVSRHLVLAHHSPSLHVQLGLMMYV